MLRPYAFGVMAVYICPPMSNGWFYPLTNVMVCWSAWLNVLRGWPIIVVHLNSLMT